MAENDNSSFAPDPTSPEAKWVPLLHGPFYFRRQPASLFERSYTHGWALNEVVKRATADFPPADPDDPNPITIWANEGEGRLWVQWVFATERQNVISLIPYFADDLEKVDEIESSVLSKQNEYGAYPPEQIADLAQDGDNPRVNRALLKVMRNVRRLVAALPAGA